MTGKNIINKRILKGLVCAVSVMIMIGVQSSPVFAALSDTQIQLFHDHIYYFNSEDVSTCSADTSTGGVTTASGLPSDVVKAINNLKPDYVKAANATNIPWQLLAAVHYREANNDPNQDLQAGNPIGGGGSQSASYPYGYPTSIEQSAEFAAKELISDSNNGVVKKPINVANPDPEAIKDTLFSYNGRASVYAQQAADLGFNSTTQPYEGSPYVMNNYDAKHHDMKIITHDFGGLDGTDTRFGAFTVYAKLGGNITGGSAPDSCDSSGAVIGNAIQTAINYAWPDYHHAPYLIMKASYKAAIDKAVANHEYVGGLSHPGVDCGGYITRVMRDSGADPNYNWGPHDSRQGATPAQQAYMDAHPEKYQNLGNLSSTSTLQPGDIAINSEHTYMYVGKQPGFNGNSASASVSFTGDGWRTPMASNAYFTNGAGSFTWYRLK
jgi:hypothetical protein